MGQIQVNISLNDADSYGGINISNSMTLDVGDIIETGSYKLIVGESFSLVGRNILETDPPYNETGAFAYIKNTSTDISSYIEVRTYLTAAETSGTAGTHTIQRLYGGEWTWLNGASKIASGAAEPRSINIRNNSSEETIIDYAVFSRKSIGGPTKIKNGNGSSTNHVPPHHPPGY